MADEFKKKRSKTLWFEILYSHSKNKHLRHKDRQKINKKTRGALKHVLNEEIQSEQYVC